MARVYSYLARDETVTRDATENVTAKSPAGVALLKKYFDLVSLAGVSRLERPFADRYVPDIAVAKGMDQAWFRELPAGPDRDPKDVNPQDAALQAEYIKRGHYGPQSFYIWNEAFVRGVVCDESDQIFRDLPKPAKVFQPSDGLAYPRYQFPPSRTLPSGLKTNRYGFRGSDFPPEHPSNVIRIAFVGSSETVAAHHFPYSFPEYFGIWLERWLAANGHPFQVEIVNAGREGIATTDVAAILDQEVLPLAPDYVFFYDGANQTYNARSFVGPAASNQGSFFAGLLKGQSLLPDSWAVHSRLAKVVNETYRVYGAPRLDEWLRPSYEFKFPPGIDETDPSIDSPDLPLGLPVFLRDLKTMTDRTRAVGVPFMISTLVWLDGSELAAEGDPNQGPIRAHLKSMFWPLNHSDIRRLIDFWNRALRQFAKSKDIGLLEVANQFPRDPDLFSDAYHMTPEGLKLLAWIELQQFLPRLSKDLQDSKLGKEPRVSVQLPPLNGDEFMPNCRPSLEVMATATVVPLATMTPGSKGSSLQPSASGVVFHSAPDPWSYIGEIPLDVGCMEGGGWVAAEIGVTHGTASVGVLNRKGDAFVASTAVAATDNIKTVFLRLDSFAAAGDFVLKNWDEKTSSEGILQAVRIATRSGQTPVACDRDPSRTKALAQARSLSLETMAPGSKGSSLQPSASGVVFHSAPDPWSYIGEIPLDVGCMEGGGWVATDIGVTHGIAGVGVLNRKGDDFVASTSVAATGHIQTVFLRLDSFAAAGDFVVRNWNEKTSSEGILQAVRIATPSGQTPKACNFSDKLTTRLPFQLLQSQNGGDLSIYDGAVTLKTPARQWAYAASSPLPLPEGASGPAVVQVRLQVEEGKLGIGVLAQGYGAPMLAEQAADVSTEPVEIDIGVADVANAGPIVLRSWSPNGVSVRARIFSIEIVLKEGPQRPDQRKVPGPTTSLPLESLQPQNGGSLSTREGDTVLTTSAQQWAYAASSPLPLPASATGPAVVHVRLQVEQGKLGIGVLARGDAAPMLAEQSVDVTTAPIDIDINVADVADAGPIILRSWSPNGVSTRARIFSIDTVLEPEPRRAASQH
jgi:hypothetical protein